MDFRIISERIARQNPLDFGSIFNRSIELFKEVWVQGFIVLLLNILIGTILYLLVYVPIFGMAITTPEAFEGEAPPIFLIITMIIYVPFLILGTLVVSLALNAAFLRICSLKDLKKGDTENYFFYLKKPYLGKMVKLALMMLALIFLGMLACGIGVIYVSVPLSLIPAFLAFNEKLSASEIIKASFALGNKNWFVIFALLLVMGLIAELGIILCCVGIFFTAMLSKIPVYFMYKDGIGSNENEQIDSVNVFSNQ